MTQPAQDISKRGFRIGAGLILALAAILRIRGAQGDLAQDEITSLGLVAKVTRFDRIFWQVNHDNNHMLNSAWLYLIGPHASVLAMRSLSIACGIAAVFAAGVWGRRRSRLTGLIAMGLFATSYLMVGYASEARGYAGMTLCAILAAIVLENILAGAPQKLLLGGIVLTGMLFHYDMAMAACVLGVAYFLTMQRRTSSLMTACDATLRIFALPAACVILAVLPTMISPYITGDLAPFQLRGFVGAYDLALETALNLPGLVMRSSDVLLAVILASWWFSQARDDAKANIYFTALIILPLALWALHVPNTDVPRHMIICGIAFIMLATDLATAYWDRARLIVCIILAAILIGNTIFLEKFFADGRGHYSAAVADMTANGPTDYGIDKPQLTVMVDFYDSGHAAATYIPMDEWCQKGAPQFLIISWVDTAPESQIDWGPPACRAMYHRRQSYPAWGLTGASWTLFARD